MRRLPQPTALSRPEISQTATRHSLSVSRLGAGFSAVARGPGAAESEWVSILT